MRYKQDTLCHQRQTDRYRYKLYNHLFTNPIFLVVFSFRFFSKIGVEKVIESSDLCCVFFFKSKWKTNERTMKWNKRVSAKVEEGMTDHADVSQRYNITRALKSVVQNVNGCVPRETRMTSTDAFNIYQKHNTTHFNSAQKSQRFRASRLHFLFTPPIKTT